MSLLVKFCFCCLAVSSSASYCNDSQHCSDCYTTTGYCITDCNPGYYDQKCESECSKNCRNMTCSTSNNGNGNCTHGCVPGFQGTSCSIPCDNPGGSCTPCPGGCDGGYCQLASSCVSGCVDSYYGTDCNHEGGYSTHLNIALVALSVICVYCTLTIFGAIVLRCRGIRREVSREPEEDEYQHIRFHRRPSADIFLHTNDAYTEVEGNDAGRVVVFL